MMLPADSGERSRHTRCRAFCPRVGNPTICVLAHLPLRWVAIEDPMIGPKRFEDIRRPPHTAAVFEAAKEAIVLLLGCGALDLIHKNLDDAAQRSTEP